MPAPAAPLSEAAMLSAESQIPRLAAQAGRQAHQRALEQTGSVIMKSDQGQLVVKQACGAIQVIKDMPAGTPTRPGSVLKRQRHAFAVVADR